ncbi:MAG: AhpC/TSA family protein [Haliscomenobacter sp.]|nr:AhpC/TSA family protein [Haliscomenobacter sp.]
MELRLFLSWPLSLKIAGVPALFLLYATALLAQTEKANFTLNAHITGLNSPYVVFSIKNDQNKWVSDTIPVSDNRFVFSINVDKTTYMRIDPKMPQVVKTVIRNGRNQGYIPSICSYIVFFGSPGQTIEFGGDILDFVNAYPSGNPENDDLAAIHRKTFPLVNQSANAYLKAAQLDESDSTRKSLEIEIKKLDMEVAFIKKEFIKAHPASVASAFYLQDMMMRRELTEEESLRLSDQLASSLAGNPFYSDILSRVKGISASKVGAVLADFSAPNVLDNSVFDIKNTNGKYVILDFWGTWCGPCISEMPEMKALSEKYADRMMLVGVNNGDTKEKLLSFVKEKGYTWTQVLDKQEGKTFSTVFNVNGYPTKIILDPKGEILGKYLGTTPDFFDKIHQLFDK